MHRCSAAGELLACDFWAHGTLELMGTKAKPLEYPHVRKVVALESSRTKSTDSGNAIPLWAPVFHSPRRQEVIPDMPKTLTACWKLPPLPVCLEMEKNIMVTPTWSPISSEEETTPWDSRLRAQVFPLPLVMPGFCTKGRQVQVMPCPLPFHWKMPRFDFKEAKSLFLLKDWRQNQTL